MKVTDGKIEEKVEPISSIQEFTSQIEEFKKEQLSTIQNSECRLVYRGAYEDNSIKERYLTPSIARAGLVRYESDINREMQRLRPFDFSNLTSKGIIEKLQHYRFPTRLLDFSLSPYVALWFAVSHEKYNVNKTPRVYCMLAREQDSVAEAISRIPTVMKSYNFYHEGQQKKDHYYVEDVLFSLSDKEQKKHKLESFLLNLYDKTKKTRVAFTYPQVYTERERNQQSIFAIFSNKIYDTFDKIYLDEVEDLKEALNSHTISERFVFVDELDLNFPLSREQPMGAHMRELVITSDRTQLENMMDELERIGINESFIFPDSIEYTSSQVVKWASKKFNVELKP